MVYIDNIQPSNTRMIICLRQSKEVIQKIKLIRPDINLTPDEMVLVWFIFIYTNVGERQYTYSHLSIILEKKVHFIKKILNGLVEKKIITPDLINKKFKMNQELNELIKISDEI